MVSNLPAPVQQILPRLRSAASTGDPQQMKRIMVWGFEQIGQVYQPDPVFRPLDYWRKKAAEREWERLVRDTAKQLRQVVSMKQVHAFQLELDLLLQQRTWEQRENQRQRATRFDSAVRVSETMQVRAHETDERIREAEALARLNGQMQQAQPTPASPMQRVREIQEEIKRIDADPSLSTAVKHRLTAPLQESMQRILNDFGP